MSDVAPSSGISLSSDSSLVVSTWSDVVDLELRLQYRVMGLTGRLHDGFVPVVTNATGTEKIDRIRVPPGLLLNVGLEIVTTTSRLGDVFARISIGGESAGNPFRFPLALGFIGGGNAISWPNIQSAPGPVTITPLRRFVGADPAANVEATLTMPTGVLVFPFSVHVRLVADANAANRLVSLLIEDENGNDVVQMSQEMLQVAGETVDHFWSIGTTPTTDATLNYIQHGGWFGTVRESWVFTTVTRNRQVGDNFGPLSVYGERHFLMNL